MDADGLPLVGPGVDYTQVDPIQQKRTVAFINHFITHTARFLNHFSGVCEEKLDTLSNRIQQLEITMSILEAKLSSVPGLENVTVATSSSSSAETPASGGTPSSSAPAAPPAPAVPAAPAVPGVPPSQPATDGAAAAVAEELAKPSKTVSQDPRYAKFFKMVQVGVPVPAVKVKMGVEGLNPDLLDTPDAPAPEEKAPAAGGDSDDDFSDGGDEDSDSVSSFSD